jgi:mitochondrial fission protein ELM1
LLGGASKHYSFDQSLVLEAIGSLTANAPTTNWLISASRRTPENFLPLVQELMQSRPNLTLVPLEQQGDNWLNERYREAEEIWLTADSASMLAESMASGAKVGVICLPLAGKKSHKLARVLGQLRSQHTIGSYDRHALTPAPQPKNCANDNTATAGEVLTLLGI